MLHESQGNGSTKIEVHQQEMGGWVRIYMDPQAPRPPDLPIFLSHALTDYFRQRPHLTMRTIQSVTVEGNTVELHAWYDLHVFPGLDPKKRTQDH